MNIIKKINQKIAYKKMMKQRKFYEYEMSLFLKEGVKFSNPTKFSWDMVGRDDDKYKALHKIPHYLIKKYVKKINWTPIGMGYKLENEIKEIVGTYPSVDELPMSFVEAFKKHLKWENFGTRARVSKTMDKIAHTNKIVNKIYGKNVEEMNVSFLKQYGKYMNWEMVGSGLKNREHVSQFSDDFVKTFSKVNIHFKVETDFRKL